MTNTKSTKRALLASVMAMLLCFTMLLGTTFAWFTDSVTVSGNKIQSGTLDIALEMWNGTEWVNAEGQTLNFISANGETDILWEPGCTYQLPKLRVVNKGNLAAKYQVQVTGIAGDAKLNEAIKWYGYYEVNQYGVQSLQRLPWNTFASQQYMVTPAGETWGMNDDTSEFQIEGVMNKNAGNEYQGLTIDGVSITVVATQATYEYDSKDNMYDENAEYPEIITAEELATVLTPVNGAITIDNDYIVTGEWTSINVEGQNITIDGKGHTISGLDKPLVAGNVGESLTIKNLTIANSNIGPAANENGLGTGAFACFKDAYGSATFENCHLVNSTVTSNYRAGGLIGYISGGELVITDCSVVNCEITGVEGAAGLVAHTQVNATITDSKVESTKITATEDRLGTKAPVAGAVVGTANGDAVVTLTNVEAIDTTVSNNNATAVHSDKIGRLVGNATVVEN